MAGDGDLDGTLRGSTVDRAAKPRASAVRRRVVLKRNPGEIPVCGPPEQRTRNADFQATGNRLARIRASEVEFALRR